MNKALIIALAALLAPLAARATEPAAAPVKPVASAPVKPVASAPAPAAAPKPATPQKTAAPQATTSESQQDRMRNCNKQAAGKKGDERRAFMKTCLSSKA